MNSNHHSDWQSAIIDVSAGLIFRSGRLLIAQRQAEAHLGGLWEFPGGKREPGETFEACLRRELQEELGCDVEVLERVETVVHAYPEKTVRIQFHRCRWVAHEPRAIGCADLRWVERGQLGKFPFPAADARLLDELRRNESFWC